MLLFGIETSCDETSVAVVREGCDVQSCIIGSSRKDFEHRGGVIPEDAARRQLEMILPIVEQALKEAHVTPTDLEGIAVTTGPGLLGSLLVGTTTARVLASTWNIPLIPVHHTLGHLSSTWLQESAKRKVESPTTAAAYAETSGKYEEAKFPILTLSVSGGHTDLWYRTSHTVGILAGSTRDDAAGEAFDKGAVLLGLPYPGGPALAALAEQGDEKKFDFPLPLKSEEGTDFSFSGLKTSLKYLLRDLGDKLHEPGTRASVAASYQHAISAHLIDRLTHAVKRFPETKEVHLVGGVSANLRLRAMAEDLMKSHSLSVRWPTSLRFCTDNGAMIAAAGEFLVREKPEWLKREFVTSATMSLKF